MAVDKHHGGLMMLLINTALLWTGVRGDSLSLYHKVGEDGSQIIEDFTRGKIKEASQRSDRLSLGSDCSLTVRDVRVQDAGRYICRQFPKEGGPQQGEDEPVYLSVLTMSSSPPVTDLEPDRPVTLSCSLSSYDGHECGPRLHTLSWVDEAGRDLQRDPRYQVTRSYCDITLTTTLKKEDNNRKFRCQLTNHKAGKVETFLDFLPSFPERPSVTSWSTSPGAPSVMPNTTPLDTKGSCSTERFHIWRIVPFAVLTIMVVIVTVFHARRTGPKAEVSSDMQLRVVEG